MRRATGCAVWVGISLWAAAASGTELRWIELSPPLAKTFLEAHPGAARTIDGSTLLLDSDAVPLLAHWIHESTGRCGGFIDITDEAPGRISPLADFRLTLGDPDLPQLSGRREPISRALGSVVAANIEAWVKRYSGSFKTRVARSAEGERASEWLKNEWRKIADDARRSDVVVELTPPPSGYRQANVRITIPGTDAAAPVVVMGGHLDSINMNGGNAPGADDDASGIGALTEAYRVLLAREARPRASIHIIGYAAEEMGLLGSRALAERYKNENVAVRAVLQLDMVAWPGESRAVTFITDNVNRALTTWTQQLYGLYVGGDVKEERCGYACSDHASWHRYGFPAVMPFESPWDEMNRRIHTARDVWDDRLDAEHAARFAKIAVAFAGEMADAFTE